MVCSAFCDGQCCGGCVLLLLGRGGGLSVEALLALLNECINIYFFLMVRRSHFR